MDTDSDDESTSDEDDSSSSSSGAAPGGETVGSTGGSGSAAASSGDAAPGVGASRTADAIITVVLPNSGRIIYYGQARPIIKVHCPNVQRHGPCVRTRRIGETADPRRGRPLGWAAAWCLECDQHDKGDHFAYDPAQSDRYIAREAMRMDLGAEWAALEAKQRHKHDGEETEGEQCY